MSTTEVDNRELVHGFLDALNRQDWDTYADCLSEDAVRHVGGDTFRGLESVMQSHKELYDAFPDLTFTVEDTVAEDERVAARLTTTGTHEGAFEGIEPTGEKVEISVIALFRIEDNTITEARGVADFLGLMKQLGVVELPGE